MSPQTQNFLKRWFVDTLAVLVAANVVKGISYSNPAGLLVASLLLGILNAFLRPLLLLLSLPLLILSLGLFALVINAALLAFVGWIVGPFDVESFWAAFWGGLVISLSSMTGHALLGTNRTRVKVGGRDQSKSAGGPNQGPIIDV